MPRNPYREDGAKVIKHFQQLEQIQMNNRPRWEEMAKYIAPSRQGIDTKYEIGVKQTRYLFDSTSMLAAEQMAMFMAGNIINPAQQWLIWDMFEPEVKDDPETKEWLEENRSRFLKRLGASLFYAEGPESFIDYGGFGTGCLFGEENAQPANRTIQGFRGFNFFAVKTGRFVIAEGPDGMVDTVMRKFEWSGQAAIDFFGKDNVSEGIRNSKDMTRNWCFIHAVYPRRKAEQGAGALGMPWASCWVEFDSKFLNKESGYRVFPAAVPRYQKTPGEVFGRGRGDLAFPDTWTLNKAKQMGLEDWALKIRPPIMVRHNAVLGTLKIIPGGPTTINTQGAPIRDTIMPFETGSRPEVSQIKEEELRRSIREIFYVEQIRQLMEVSKSEMTAFEFRKKLEILYKLLGPVYGRLEWEFLHRIADVGFDLMEEAGEFSPPPPIVDQYTTGHIITTFRNPLALAQRSGDAESLTMVLSDVGPLVETFPQMLDWIDPDDAMQGVMDIRGYPNRWKKRPQAVQDLRASRQAMQEQQQQLATGAQIAESGGKISPLLKGPSRIKGMKAIQRWLTRKWNFMYNPTEIEKAYYVTFCMNPHGQLVLQHLMDNVYCTIAPTTSPEEALVHNARRSVIQEILENLDRVENAAKYSTLAMHQLLTQNGEGSNAS